MPEYKPWDAAVIGAGVVGLATARELLAHGLEKVIVLDAVEPGAGASGRNSGVLHPGFEYPPGTLKARLAVDGARRTFDFAEKHGVPVRRSGILVVATDASDRGELERLKAQGEANGTDVALVTRAEVAKLEPEVRAEAALYAPEAATIDPRSYLRALADDVVHRGGLVKSGVRVEAVERAKDSTFTLKGGLYEIRAKRVVNAAGVHADEVARLAEPRVLERIAATSGRYVVARGRSAGLVSRPVYPVFPKGTSWLGIHVTPAFDGTLLLGPDSTPLKDKGPGPEAGWGDVDAFHAAVARFLPDLAKGDLAPGPRAVRAKLAGPGYGDFIVRETSPGWVDFLGIESPGVTCALGLADLAADALLGEKRS